MNSINCFKKVLTLSLFFFIFFWGTSSFAVNAVQASNSAIKSFVDIDNYFINQYSGLAKEVGQGTRPLLVVNGFQYQLYLKDGTVKKFSGLLSPFEELKAVSHIGPCLFAIASPAWEHPDDMGWKPKLTALQAAVKIGLQNVDMVDWRNVAWPNQEQNLKQFMHDSLQMVDNFITRTLQKNAFTKQDYEEFARHYMHTMLATMYLADVGNTFPVIKQLKQWKNELGETQWDNLYVLVTGTKGRASAELTIDTNTSAITVATLMKPENVKTHIIIMPMASTFEQAEATLGQVITATKLAKATFITHRAQQATGIYKALLTADVPLAKANIVRITGKDALNNKVSLPEIGILKKDKAFAEALSK